MEVEHTKYQVTAMRTSGPPVRVASFSESLQGPVEGPGLSVATAVIRHVDTILAEEAALDGAMSRTLDGETMGQREMLELQATVYSYSQRVEVATRVIDRGAAALKQLLNTQL